MSESAGATFGSATVRLEIEQALSALLARWTTDASPLARELVETAREYVLRPAKRMRPLLCLAAAQAAGGEKRPAVELGAALEVLHAFLLVHDDIADRANTRRGGPALHVRLAPKRLAGTERARLGENLAVVAGDWLYTVALSELHAISGVSPEARRAAIAEVLATCRSTAEGQFADIALATKRLAFVDPDDVLSVYRLKTARYSFEGPLVAGALLAGAGPSLVARLRAFATAAGIAFQLEDDLASLYSGVETTGKPALADLREGKRTWPVLVAWQRGSSRDRQAIERMLGREDADEADLLRLRGIVRDTGALAASLALVDRACDDAAAALGPEARELAPVLAWLRANRPPIPATPAVRRGRVQVRVRSAALRVGEGRS